MWCGCCDRRVPAEGVPPALTPPDAIRRALNVTLVLQRDAGRPLRVGLAVPLRGTVAELRAMVAREGDVPPEQVPGLGGTGGTPNPPPGPPPPWCPAGDPGGGVPVGLPALAG